MTYILVRYGELWLKGKKRSFFERALVQNLKYTLNAGHHPHTPITRKPGRIVIETSHNYKPLSTIPGIVSFSVAHKTEPTTTGITETLKTLFPLPRDSFCVRVQRLEKVGPSSQEWEREIGAFVVQETGKKVDLSHPDVTLGIELFQDAAFLFFERFAGCGGLPQVKEGRLVLLLHTEKDIIAGKLLLKRGCVPDVYSPSEALYTALVQGRPSIPLNRVSCFTGYDFVAMGDAREDIPLPALLPLEGLSEEEILHLGER